MIIAAAAHAEFTPRAIAVLVIGGVLLAVGWFAWWRIDVEINPYAPCRWCGGSGKGRFSRKGAFNVCKHGRERPRAFAKAAAARHDQRRR